MNRIRELRKYKNITQEYLAQQLGVVKLTISKWERGIHQIKSDKAEMLSSILGVPLPYLLGIDDVSEQDLPVYKQCILELNNVSINLLRNIDKLTSQNLSDIKREARNLYESLVRLQCEAERIETWKRVKNHSTGNRIKELRKANKLTPQRVSGKIRDFPLELFKCGKWENLSFIPKMSKLADFFGVSITDLLTFLDPKGWIKLKSLGMQKATIPKFVADWYEGHKDDFEGNLFRCIDQDARSF